MALVTDLRPSLFADLSPDVAFLRGVDISLSGQLQIEADGGGDIRGMTIEVTGGEGLGELAWRAAGDSSGQVGQCPGHGECTGAYGANRPHRRRLRRHQDLDHRSREEDSPEARPSAAAPRCRTFRSAVSATTGPFPSRRRPHLGARQSQRRRDRCRRRVRPEHARSRSGAARGRSHGGHD